MTTERYTTPPPSTAAANPQSPLTPEQVRRIEINRLKAKALREQNEAGSISRLGSDSTGTRGPASLQRSGSSNLAAGQKRNFATYVATPATSRDARNSTPGTRAGSVIGKDSMTDRPLETIQPARNFAKYVEYDFSKMTDTKGGFLTQEDDPHNKVMHAADLEAKPPGMTLKEWERQQLLRTLKTQKAGPFEPGIQLTTKDEDGEGDTKKCRECGVLEIDWKWEEIFGCSICNACKEKFPEKYSLLTKTEAKEDYLLTDPELRDENLLPHIERPNPHKSTWNNMMLFLRYQIEDYAFSDKKWGSPEELDAEFERRQTETKRRKENKFKSKLEELKKKTRVEAYRRSQRAGGGGAGGNFGDDLRREKNHVHEWGRVVEDPSTGSSSKTCVDCGMEVEEVEF